MKRAKWVAAGLALLPVVTLTLFHLATSKPELKLVEASLTDGAGKRSVVALPYRNDRQTEKVTYHYRLAYDARESTRNWLHVTPDDCVRLMEVNGRAVPLQSIGAAKLCDYTAGFTIDIGDYLKEGTNIVEMTVENLGGPHGLAVQSVRGPQAGNWLSWLLLALLAGACGLAVAPLIRMRALSIRGGAAAALVLAAAGWIRYRFVFDWQRPEDFIFSDMSGYVDHAQEIARGVLQSGQAFQPIGYPMILAASLKLVGDFSLADGLQVVLSWATVALVWRASARWLGERSGLVALALAAFHFPLIALTGFFLAETTFAFQLALLFYGLARFSFPWKPVPAFILGLTYMSALWIKGNNTLFGPLVMAWIALWVWQRRHATPLPELAARLIKPALGFCAGTALMVASHGIATYAMYGHASFSAGTGALNLVEGKCPSKRNYDSLGYGWQSPLFVQLGEANEKHWPRPFSDQAFFWAEGMNCIQNDPWVLVTSLRYIYYLFFDNQLWPPNTTASHELVRASGMLFSALLFPLLLLGTAVLLRRPTRRSGLFTLAGFSIMLCSWLFKSELRYRVPFDVFFIPLAVLGVSWLFARLRTRARGVNSKAEGSAITDAA